MHFYIRAIALILCSSFVHAQEFIESFESIVDVHRDASLTVQEKITVVAAQDKIKRGIVRSFPTRYALLGMFNASVGFTVTSVQRNGQPTAYEVKNTVSGSEIHLGDDTLIEPGTHVYDITYTTNRQLGFFKEHDELYWNAIGTDWDFPINSGSVTVNLPVEIPADAITAEAYTGKQGEQKQDYHVTKHNNTVTIETTKPLARYEGMTIVVTWPKGYITEPTWYQKLIWFLQDDGLVIWFFLCLLLALCWYLVLFLYSRNQHKPGIIIPLFYPPKNMTPAAVGFIKNKAFNDKFIAPEMVYLAVHDYLTIAYEEASNTYTLLRTEKIASDTGGYQGLLLSTLFGEQKSVILNKANSPHIVRVKKFLEQQYATQYDRYINHYKKQLYIGFFIALMGLGPLLFVSNGTVAWVVLFMIFSMHHTVEAATRSYTTEGQRYADEIAGFKLFLETTETDRLKIIGTPPTKTPELYEHYLPYAMVLGVEEAWTKQFTPVFAKLAQENKPYMPIWYIGGRWNDRLFAQGFYSAVKTSLPQAPGWRSGAGGTGFSGGGGGGGGGGGR